MVRRGVVVLGVSLGGLAVLLLGGLDFVGAFDARSPEVGKPIERSGILRRRGRVQSASLSPPLRRLVTMSPDLPQQQTSRAGAHPRGQDARARLAAERQRRWPD